MMESVKNFWRTWLLEKISHTSLARKYLRAHPATRSWLHIGGILAVVFVAAALAAQPAYQRYRKYREETAVKQAEEALGRKDLRTAALNARRALTINQKNLAACRIMARVSALANLAQTLDWQQRIVELSPTLEDKLALAMTAIQMESPPCGVAAQTLDGLKEQCKGSVSYHLLCAKLALKLDQGGKAEEHFRQASILEPTNQLHTFNLATLRLSSTNPATAGEARATLEQLKHNTNLWVLAMRWLVGDHVQRHQWQAAETRSHELLNDPRAELDDRLQHLEILLHSSQTRFRASLKSVQALVSTNPPQIYVVAKWMIGRNMAGPAFDWLRSFPAKIQAKPSVRLALGECYASRKQWPELVGYLEEQEEGGEWGELEFLRLALLSYGSAGQQRELAAQSNWRLALRQTGGQLGGLLALLQFATVYDMPARREEVLWEVARKYPGAAWAFRELITLYGKAGNTAGLNRVYGILQEANPRDSMLKNDFAASSMLLKVNLPKAHQFAQELYAQHAQDPIIVSTYAYSLCLQGQTKAGLAALEKLKPETLEDPSLALYYALLLDADGQTDKALTYAKLTRNAPLLPEEKELRDTLLKR